MSSGLPSSSRAGFFQAVPTLSKHWQEDAVLQRVVKRTNHSIDDDMSLTKPSLHTVGIGS